jgi:hypothetical protein
MIGVKADVARTTIVIQALVTQGACLRLQSTSVQAIDEEGAVNLCFTMHGVVTDIQ